MNQWLRSVEILNIGQRKQKLQFQMTPLQLNIEHFTDVKQLNTNKKYIYKISVMRGFCRAGFESVNL